MVVAIMQPYFFPYIGYFQLIGLADCFVIYDEAQYMKGGWINRNRILHNGAPRWWTYPVEREDHRLPISQRRYQRSPAQDQTLLDKLDAAYRRAPFHASARELVERCLDIEEACVSVLNEHQLSMISAHLGTSCKFVRSSDIEHNRSLLGEDRVVELCSQLGATRYLNPMGGRVLYQREAFDAVGIEIGFVSPRPLHYRQFVEPMVPFLSIVDVLMFNPVDDVRAMLCHHDIVPPLR